MRRDGKICARRRRLRSKRKASVQSEQCEADPVCPPGYSAVNGQENRNLQHAKRQGEEPTLAEIVRIPQSSKADDEEQDNGEKAGDVESKAPHNMIACHVYGYRSVFQRSPRPRSTHSSYFGQ
jgi:hypothetical protein